MPRALLSIGLLLGGLVAAGFAWVHISDPTLFSILVGIASTGVTSGLVDGSALLERRRQEAPIRQLVARRIGRVHQLTLQIVQVLFDDLTVNEVSDWPDALRAAPEGPIDLTTMANVYPPRTRAQFLVDLRKQLHVALDELRTLSAAGVMARDVDFLDRAIAGPFLSAVEAGTLIPLFRTRQVIARQAADLLDMIQTRLPAAQKVAGSAWRFGSFRAHPRKRKGRSD